MQIVYQYVRTQQTRIDDPPQVSFGFREFLKQNLCVDDNNFNIF